MAELKKLSCYSDNVCEHHIYISFQLFCPVKQVHLETETTKCPVYKKLLLHYE